MENKEAFKNFVREHPKLVSFVKSGDMSWQKFYEMYDLYGAEHEVWNDYIKKPDQPKVDQAAAAGAATGALGIAELVNMFKNVDLDSIQNGVNSIQRVLGVFQDFNKKDTPTKETYKPRPIYKHFED